MARKHNILIISLGGTIALDIVDGRAQATTNINSLLAQLKAVDVDLSSIVFSCEDSVNLSLSQLAKLATYIQSQAHNFTAVILTMGTDTLEDVAFFLHLSLANSVNLVVTGAMRPPYSEQFDGIENLEYAIEIAKRHVDYKQVVVAMQRQVLPAQNVIKTSAFGIQAFTSIAVNMSAPVAHYTLPQDIEALKAIRIPIIHISLGAHIDKMTFRRAHGVILVCPGAFSLPDKLIRNIQTWKLSIPIVLCSRCVECDLAYADIYPNYLDAMEQKGFIIREFAGLSPSKAKLKLLLQLVNKEITND